MAINEAESPGWRTYHGGFVPGCAMQPAFSVRAPVSSPLPVLIAVPHAGRAYPSAVLANMRDPDFTCIRLEDRFVDLVADEVAQLTGATLIVAHAPRAMLDLNRAREDIDWDMISCQRPHPVRHSLANRRARSGLGLVPRRLPGFGEIWRGRISREELDQRIDGIHRPYHSATARELERIRDEWGAALLIDLHSMPPLHSSSTEFGPPEFVLGDRFGASCDESIVRKSVRFLGANGKTVAHNRPYAGGFVLDIHGSPSLGLHALQVEICRSTYLDARLAEPVARIGLVTRLLAGLVRELGEAAVSLGRNNQDLEAAE